MKKRLCSILLCAALFITIGGPVAKAVAVSAPSMTVEVNQVKEGTTVEVSLIVEGGELSQSAHAVLSYDPAKLTLKSWGDGGPITPTATPMAGSTMAPGNVAGKPSLVYQPDGSTRALLYLGASDAQNGMGADKALVTVQFAYAGDGKTGDITEGNLNDYVSIAAAGSFDQLAMAAYPAVLHLKDETNSRYIYGYGETLPAGYQAMTVDFALESKPSLYNNTGAVVSGDHAITFFDWDGAVIEAVSGGGDMRAAVAALTDKSAALTKKAGYDFDTWLTVTSDSEGLHTAYGTLTSSKSGITAENRDIADFSNVQSNLLVQAAYKTNTGVNSGQGADSSLTEDTARYMIGAPTFYQYGISPDATNGQYAVRCTVERSSVLRADKPTVLAMVYVGSGSNMKAVTVKVDLDSTDSTSFEVVVPKATTNITFTVLDTYGVTAWTMGTSRSKEGSAANSEIVKGGSFALLVDEAWTAAQGGGWTSYINVQCFQDAGYPKVSTSNLDAAKAALAAKSKDGKLDRTAADAALAAYK